jgi:hypothetical protein
MATRTEALLDKLSAESKRIVGYIMTFAGSQGLYGRLMRDLLKMAPEQAEEWLSQYHHCNDCLDFVMEYEG